MDVLNLHPIITPLFALSSAIYLASFWQAKRQGYMTYKVLANVFEVLAMAVAGLWTGVAVGMVSLVLKTSAVWGYGRFSITTKVALVLTAFGATILLQDRALAGFEFLPLVAFLYGRSLEQFVPNRQLRIASLPVQVFYMAYFGLAGRIDGMVLEGIHLLNNLYTWAFRRHKLHP